MEMIELSLGQLARRIPGATRLFDAHRLDFCCGGNKTLRAAAAAAGVDTAPIVEELRLLAEIAAASVTGRTPRPPSWWNISWRATTPCTASSCPS